MTVTIDPWTSAYGSALRGEDDQAATAGPVDVEVEAAVADWAPLDPRLDPAEDVLFVDGVRRIDARAWVPDRTGTLRLGLCVSYAAGTIRCRGGAALESCEVRRGLFTVAGADAIDVPGATYRPLAVASDDLDSLVGGVQQRLGDLEIAVAAAAGGADLVVVDGPLSGRQNVPGAVGYIKTHRVTYLPEQVGGILAALAPGQRTPLFLTQTTWSRYSWYLRLPFDRTGHPLAAIVRCEASADLEVSDARRLADLATATLPRFASRAHKDPRAPQNLYPIAGLERALRRRLGDVDLLVRRLRRATA